MPHQDVENTLPTATLRPLLETPEPWDGKSRVNILIMGFGCARLKGYCSTHRYHDPVHPRPGEPHRRDDIHPAGLVSKDSSSDYNKINTAYSISESYSCPAVGQP